MTAILVYTAKVHGLFCVGLIIYHIMYHVYIGYQVEYSRKLYFEMAVCVWFVKF